MARMLVNTIDIDTINKAKLPVGSTVDSMLTEVQFQNLNGPEWVLADGRSVVGSAYETITSASNIPDFRGQFKRGRNNGRADGQENPDGDLALGAYQADQFLSHTHTYERHTVTGGGSGPGLNQALGTLSTGAAGGNETRSKNITINIFIKIN